MLRLLENETMEKFSMEERSKSRHKFDGMKVCEAEEAINYFIWKKCFDYSVNQIIYGLDLRNILCYSS